jgi:hypothetical protein
MSVPGPDGATPFPVPARLVEGALTRLNQFYLPRRGAGSDEGSLLNALPLGEYG